MSPVTPSVTSFIAALPAPRRESVRRVREVIMARLPAGYEEVVSGRMLCYQVPLAAFPDTRNKKPLWYAALASEKSYLSLHLMSVYADPRQLSKLKAGFAKAGKTLDMGKACIHFQEADDLPLELLGEMIGAFPMAKWIALTKEAWKQG